MRKLLFLILIPAFALAQRETPLSRPVLLTDMNAASKTLQSVGKITFPGTTSVVDAAWVDGIQARDSYSKTESDIKYAPASLGPRVSALEAYTNTVSAHMSDAAAHVSAQDRVTWNAKAETQQVAAVAAALETALSEQAATNSLFAVWLSGISGNTNLWNEAWSWSNHALAGYAGTGMVAAVASDLAAHTNNVSIHLTPEQAQKIEDAITSTPPQSVTSVNGQTGSVVITASSLGALTNTPTLAQSAAAGGFAGTETISPMNIIMGGHWKAVTGGGTSKINSSALGANQSGRNNGGVQTIGTNAYGASQIGYNSATQAIGGFAYGASQIGYNYSTQIIGTSAVGAKQFGYNVGMQIIGNYSSGADQSGDNYGTMSIGANSYGAMQRGQTDSTSSASNNAVGAIQIYNLSPGQRALTTPGGAASILLGAGTVSNKNAVVAGDGAASNGDGSITAAGGFFGSGANLSGVAKPADVATKLDRVSGVATNLSVVSGFNLEGFPFTRNPTLKTLEIGLTPNVNLALGQESLKPVTNNSDRFYRDGEAVILRGYADTLPSVIPATSTNAMLLRGRKAVVTEPIPPYGSGFVCTDGTVGDFTNHPHLFMGDALFVTRVPGVYTNVAPAFPEHAVSFGSVASGDRLDVHIQVWDNETETIAGTYFGYGSVTNAYGWHTLSNAFTAGDTFHTITSDDATNGQALAVFATEEARISAIPGGHSVKLSAWLAHAMPVNGSIGAYACFCVWEGSNEIYRSASARVALSTTPQQFQFQMSVESNLVFASAIRFGVVLVADHDVASRGYLIYSEDGRPFVLDIPLSSGQFAFRSDLDNYYRKEEVDDKLGGFGSISYQDSNNVSVVTAKVDKLFLPIPTGSLDTAVLPSLYRAAIQSPAVVTVAQDKAVYMLNLSQPSVITNNLSSLSFGGRIAEWKLMVNLTTTNALTTTIAGVSFDTVPEFTVTGRYEFAMTSIDGIRVQAKQTWPETYAWTHMVRMAGLADVVGTWVSFPGDGSTNYVFFNLPNTGLHLVRVRAKAAGNGPTGTYWLMPLTQGNAARDVSTAVSTNGFTSLSIGQTFDLSGVLSGSGGVALVGAHSPQSIYAEYRNCLYRPLNALERAAYSAGWRP